MRGVLLGQSVVSTRKYALIQGSGNLIDPEMVKMVENASINSRPVVDGHG
jgi:hypothetical protein